MASPDLQYDNSLDGARAWFAQQGLVRPSEGRMAGGVSAAIARRYHVNVLVVRVAVLAAAIALTPLLYVIAWVLMPDESHTVAPIAATS